MNVTGVLFFSNPALWGGTLALFIPLAVHIFTQHATQTLYFPSIRFLSKARQGRSWLHRLRHLILFLVRTLAVLLLLYAFLKPLIRQGRPVATGKEKAAPTTVIVLLDASASMGCRVLGGSLFSRARQAAHKVLAALSDRDKVNLVLAAGKPQLSFDKPSPNKTHIKLDLDSARVSRERADLNAALAAVNAQLAMNRRGRAEVYLISDFQRSNWNGAPLETLPERCKVVYLPIQADHAINCCVNEVTLKPPFPIAGEKIDVVCKIANAGGEEAVLPVEVSLGESETVQRSVTIPPRVTVTEVFTLSPGSDGMLEGVVVLPDNDSLGFDNKRYFTLPVSERLDIRFLTHDADKPDAAARMLMAAINPYIKEQDKEQGGGMFRVDLARYKPPPLFTPARDHIVILSNARPLAPDTLKSLLNYLRAGGSLILFLASEQDRANAYALAREAEGELTLPFLPLIERRFEADTGDTPGETLAQANFNHPVFRKFRDCTNLTDLRFTRYFTTERVKAQGRILARYSSGDVAMASQHLDAGTLLICNFSVNGGNLVRSVLFVPLMHEMIKAVRPARSAARLFVTGEPCSTSIKGWGGEQALVFKAPGNQTITGLLDIRGDETAVLIPATPAEGFYRVFADGRRLSSMAVNVDKRESALETWNTAELTALTQEKGGQFVAPEAATLVNVAHLRHGRPVWHYFMAGALVFLALEQLLWLVWRR